MTRRRSVLLALAVIVSLAIGLLAGAASTPATAQDADPASPADAEAGPQGPLGVDDLTAEQWEVLAESLGMSADWLHMQLDQDNPYWSEFEERCAQLAEAHGLKIDVDVAGGWATTNVWHASARRARLQVEWVRLDKRERLVHEDLEADRIDESALAVVLSTIERARTRLREELAAAGPPRGYRIDRQGVAYDADGIPVGPVGRQITVWPKLHNDIAFEADGERLDRALARIFDETGAEYTVSVPEAYVSARRSGVSGWSLVRSFLDDAFQMSARLPSRPFNEPGYDSFRGSLTFGSASIPGGPEALFEAIESAVEDVEEVRWYVRWPRSSSRR